MERVNVEVLPGPTPADDLFILTIDGWPLAMFDDKTEALLEWAVTVMLVDVKRGFRRYHNVDEV